MSVPTPKQIQEFMNNYDNYSTYCGYAIQWITSVDAIAKQLQLDPTVFTYCLDQADQMAVIANMQAAEEARIQPVNPEPVPVPPTPPVG